MYKMAGRGVLSAKNFRDHTNNYMRIPKNPFKTFASLPKKGSSDWTFIVFIHSAYILRLRAVTQRPEWQWIFRQNSTIFVNMRWMSGGEYQRYLGIVWLFEKQIVWQNLMSVSTHTRIELSKKSPIYSLPKLWNELDNTRFQHSRTTFSVSIKDKLLNEPNFHQ